MFLTEPIRKVLVQYVQGLLLFQSTNFSFHTHYSFAAIALLELMLELDSERRITAEQALAHEYLAQYADATDEPTSPPFNQNFEDMDLTVEKWKGILLFQL
jgi:p38 MAP kinase